MICTFQAVAQLGGGGGVDWLLCPYALPGFLFFLLFFLFSLAFYLIVSRDTGFVFFLLFSFSLGTILLFCLENRLIQVPSPPPPPPHTHTISIVPRVITVLLRLSILTYILNCACKGVPSQGQGRAPRTNFTKSGYPGSICDCVGLQLHRHKGIHTCRN